MREVAVAPFQARVAKWVSSCLGLGWVDNKPSRNHHFLEEALELVQACGCTESEAHQLVQYVFRRPAGEKKQEAGGALVTLNALCEAHGIDLDTAGEAELARIWPLISTISDRIKAKPQFKPLDVALPLQRAAELLLKDADALKQCHTVGGNGDWSTEPDALAAHEDLLAVAAALPMATKLPALTPTTNAKLDVFSRVWSLNGDWMTCKGCKRSLIASRTGEELGHGAGCKHAAQQHPWKQLIEILTGSTT